MLRHLAAAERAVEAHAEQGHLRKDRCVERLRRLAAQGAAAGVHDGSGHHHRHARAEFLEQRVYAEQRGLGVQRVEHRLHHQQVRAAVQKPARRLLVGRRQFVERNVAVAGVFHVRRYGRRSVGGAERAYHETRLFGRPGAELVGDLAGDARRFAVHLIDVRFQLVVRLRDRRGGEGVGGEQVRARVQVFALNLPHHVRPRQRQHVVVAPQVVGMLTEAFAAEVRFRKLAALQHRAPRAVHHHHPLGQDFFQSGSDVGYALVPVGHSVKGLSKVIGRGVPCGRPVTGCRSHNQGNHKGCPYRHRRQGLFILPSLLMREH